MQIQLCSHRHTMTSNTPRDTQSPNTGIQQAEFCRPSCSTIGHVLSSGRPILLSENYYFVTRKLTYISLGASSPCLPVIFQNNTNSKVHDRLSGRTDTYGFDSIRCDSCDQLPVIMLSFVVWSLVIWLRDRAERNCFFDGPSILSGRSPLLDLLIV